MNCGEALFLLLTAYCLCSLPLTASFEVVPSAEDAPRSDSSQNLKKLKVKLAGGRLLSTGKDVSRTRGTIDFQGFKAHMKFNTVSLGSRQAGAVNVERRVKMPFTTTLENYSNNAAAGSAPFSPAADEAKAAANDSLERHQRIISLLRAIAPAIRKRIVVIRLRRKMQQDEPVQRPTVFSSAAAEAPFGSSKSLGGEGSGEESSKSEDVEKLKTENEELRRLVKSLKLAVRGLIRRSVNLGSVAMQKQQDEESSLSAAGEPDNNHSGAVSQQMPLPMAIPMYRGPADASPVESPAAFNVRRVILKGQYPPLSSKEP